MAKEAGHLDFYRQRNEQDRRLVAAQMIPELGAYLKPRAGPNLLYSRALRVLDHAAKIVRDETLPTKSAEARANIDEMAAEITLDPDFASATTKKQRERIIRRLLEAKLGLRDPDPEQLIQVATAR